MRKPTINMMSEATSIKGQGVGSAYIEQVKLVKEGLGNKFNITVNKKQPADITHYHTINFGYSMSKPFRTDKGVSVGYVHMLPETVETSIQLPRFMKKAFYWYMIRFYKSMDYLVTVNPYFIGRLEHYGVDRSKVTYIPNFVSEETFHPVSPERKAEVRLKYGIAPDSFVVMSAGQLQVRKGIFDFLKIAEKMPEITFVWAGGFSFGVITDGYERIKKIVDNPPKNVKFLGMVEREDMNDVYNIADVMLLASFEELFPMTILEAMCVNVPVLLRDLEIYDDILFDYYYRENDVDGFVSAIDRLKNDKAYYDAGVLMSKTGNEFYSREHVTKMWDDFYTMVYKNLVVKRKKRLETGKK